MKMFAEYLEKHKGPLTVSINEHNYSTGRDGNPDMIFGSYAIEVKRVEFLCKHRFQDGEMYHAFVGHMSLLHESWNWLKEWTVKNKKTLILVVVLTLGYQPPIFIKFSQDQIDALQQQQKHKAWIQLNVWDILKQGKMLHDDNFTLM